MLTFLKQYGHNIHSQNGEDGLTMEIFNRLAIDPKEVCEYGAHDGKFCSNTRYWLEQGAHGVLVEADEDLYLKCQANSEDVNADVYWSMVVPDTVNLMVPPDLDLWSLDTDGANDYFCFKAYAGMAQVVIVEVNSGYLPMDDRLEDGANYSAMLKLGIEKGYFLVAHTGNLVFVLNEYRDKFPEIVGDGISNWQEYFLSSWQ
ncbi:MAG: hypothetical protein H0X33_14840 [Taibaiella sp.]|nr:hypothetical protein [Taibaiella sp.]